MVHALTLLNDMSEIFNKLALFLVTFSQYINIVDQRTFQLARYALDLVTFSRYDIIDRECVKERSTSASHITHLPLNSTYSEYRFV